MTDESIQSTWATRELPILVAALRRLDTGASSADLEEVRQETGLEVGAMRAGIEALRDADPPYLRVDVGNAWRGTANGMVRAVTERTRRELGSWPSAPDIVDRLAAALAAAADQETEPERKSKLRASADVLAGMARDIAVGVITAQIGKSV